MIWMDIMCDMDGYWYFLLFIWVAHVIYWSIMDGYYDVLMLFA